MHCWFERTLESRSSKIIILYFFTRGFFVLPIAKENWKKKLGIYFIPFLLVFYTRESERERERERSYPLVSHDKIFFMCDFLSILCPKNQSFKHDFFLNLNSTYIIFFSVVLMVKIDYFVHFGKNFSLLFSRITFSQYMSSLINAQAFMVNIMKY